MATAETEQVAVPGGPDPLSPRFSRLMASVLGSPFLTTSDLPLDFMSMPLGEGDEMETVDGAFVTVPRAQTITRPASPTPSFRTDAYSIVDWTDNTDIFTSGVPPNMTDAMSAYTYTSSTPRRSGTGISFLNPPTPYSTFRFSPTNTMKNSRSFGLFPKLWDALRDSTPVKKGKRRSDLTQSIWSELEADGYIDYANLPPLDGEEGELIDDEACFIDIRAVTGVDIISQVPDEIALYLLTFLDVQDILSCSRVSRTWYRLSSDNAVWRALFAKRKSDGWAIDLRRTRGLSLTPASLFASAHSLGGNSRRAIPAPLELNWHDLYKTRIILERRWTASPCGPFGTEDKENTKAWEPRVRRLSGHTDSVYCLEFDSSRIITGSRDKTIKVWSLKTGRCLATFAGHRGSVLCLKFEKDWDLNEGNTVISGPAAGWRKGFMVTGSSDCSVCVWDLYACPMENEDGDVEMMITAEVRAVLRGHTGGVLDLRIDENWIVSCSKDAMIRVWNRQTLALHCTFIGHEGPVNAVGLQGNRVVSASGDGKMMLWDITTGHRLRTLEGHDRGLACIEFKDDTIVSGSNDCKIKVWKASTGECIRTLVGHDLLVRALSFDPLSGRLVSGSYDRTVKVWDMHTGKMVREFKGCHVSHIFDVRFDCSRIVSTSHDQKIVIMDFADGLDASLFA